MKGRVKKITQLLLISSLCTLNLTACINDNQAVSEAVKINNNEIKIGVVVYNGKDPFIKSICESIEEYKIEKEESSKVNIRIDVIDGEDNQQIQNQKIDEMFKEDYDALAVNLVDRAQAASIIDKAKEKDIPLVFFNREPVPQDMEKWDKVYYIGSKADQAGKMQGQILLDAIANGLEVDKNKDGVIQYVMLEGEQGHQDAILRSYHSIKMLEDNEIKTENLATDTGSWKRSIANEKMKSWIEQHGNNIEVVMANNDEMALGAIEALEASEYYADGGNMIVLGVDGLEEGLEAIENGKMLGTVYNNAEVQGKYIFDTLYELAIGIEPYNMKEKFDEEKYLWASHEMINIENIQEYKK
ncbi:MAG: galactose ABC transporter substrate-binding protein [Cellulosilyticaceae bacterium]